MKVCGDFISIVTIIKERKKEKKYAETIRNETLPYPRDFLKGNM